MRIKFELENSDIECDFTPDFRMSANYADETQVSWRLSDNRSAADLTASLSQSHITMRQDAFAKAAAGITTIGEVLRATQDTDIDY